MTENNTISTPNIRKYKRMGVRRIGANKINACKTPLSESKISMIIATTSSSSDSPKTPLAGSNLETHHDQRESKSTGCLPVYRLSMSKRFRSQYKKKKLEFSTAADDRETKTFPTEQISSFKLDLHTKTESNNNINRKIFIENNIVSKQHESKISELNNAIEIWKTAFKTCLDDLSNKLNEDKEMILQRLQISSDMLKLA